MYCFIGETEKSARITYAELHASVARLAKSLRRIGVTPGDRVAAYTPNLIETAIAMLATASIGAIWCSCATDIGAEATLERFGQVEPKVLFTADGYFYKGKTFNTLAKAAEVARSLPSLVKVIVIEYAEEKADISGIPNSVYYDEFVANDEQPEIQFEQLPFEHPL